MATAQTIISAALLRINALQRPGETPQTEMSDYGLQRLNVIIDQWAATRDYLYEIASHRYALVSGQQQYTLGPSGADWTGQRPSGPPPGNGIKNANYIWAGQDPVIRQPIYIMNDDEWAALRVPNNQTDIIVSLYNQNTYPNATIFLYGEPQQANEIELFTYVSVAQFATLATTFSGPPGYQEAMEAVLAEALYPAFQGLASVQNVDYGIVAEQARKGVATIQRLNRRTFYQANDYGGLGKTKSGPRGTGSAWWPYIKNLGW